MTALLESPVGTLDVSLLEERQPDVPLTCTDHGWGWEAQSNPECGKPAYAEGMCMGCAQVFRRCREHYDEEAHEAAKDNGRAFRHLDCRTWFYLAQYVRIGA